MSHKTSMGLICLVSRGLGRPRALRRNDSPGEFVSMLRCLFTNVGSDLLCRSSPCGKWIGRRNLARAGFFYSTQATKMDVMSDVDRRYQVGHGSIPTQSGIVIVIGL